MGNRLSKIVTRTGDKGETGLGDGSRLPKDDLRIHCLGEIDELNSWVGMIRAALADDDMLQLLLSQIQHDLFDLGGELAMPGYQALNESMVEGLEEALEDYNALLPPMKDFILPAGNEATARCHMTRTVARRAELADHPHNGWSLFGLQAALAGQGRSSADVDADFDASWARADTWLRASSF